MNFISNLLFGGEDLPPPKAPASRRTASRRPASQKPQVVVVVEVMVMVMMMTKGFRACKSYHGGGTVRPKVSGLSLCRTILSM